jgi:hypothetical protein
MNTRDRCPIIPSTEEMSIRNAIVISDTGGRIVVLVVLVEPVLRLKMAEGYPVLFSLKSWVMGDGFLDSIFMVTFKSYPEGTFTFMVSELPPQSFLCIIVTFNVTSIVL